METIAPPSEPAIAQLDESVSTPSPTTISGGVVRLLDLVCDVTVVVGTGNVTVRDCLTMTPGRILVLDQPAGEDLTVMANGVTVVKGEISIDDEITSVRVTEIAPSPIGEL